jgi:Skp family chaperone for outer membrane proteins
MRASHLLLSMALGLLTAAPAAAQAPSSPASSPSANPFSTGARIAFVSLDRVVAASTEGRTIDARLQDLRARKGAEVDTRGKQLQALEAKLASDVLNELARTQLRREFERARIDFERFSEDAQAEVQQARQQLQVAFGQKLFPVIGEIAREKDLWAVFSADGPLLWHDPTLDISDEVARRIDAAARPAEAPKPQ